MNKLRNFFGVMAIVMLAMCAFVPQVFAMLQTSGVLLGATVGGLALTLSDWALRTDPDGATSDIVEILNQTNQILDDMLFVESNQPTSHKTTVRTGLPSAAWRMLNYGVQGSKSKTKQVTDEMGMLSSLSEIDKKLADLNGNTAAFRLSEERSFIESMNQEMAEAVFYGTDAEPEKFVGFAARYDGTPQDTDRTLSTYNIVDAGGTSTDNTSIWLIVWGANTCFGIFPKGTSAGLKMTDMSTANDGEGVLLTDADGGKYRGYQTVYEWDTGLVVRDWQYVVRIANIDVSELDTVANTKLLVQWMIEASEKIPHLGMGNAVYYCNRKIRTKLRLGILEKISTNLVWETVAGKRVMMFDDIPVRISDAILNTEARVL